MAKRTAQSMTGGYCGPAARRGSWSTTPSGRRRSRRRVPQGTWRTEGSGVPSEAKIEVQGTTSSTSGTTGRHPRD